MSKILTSNKLKNKSVVRLSYNGDSRVAEVFVYPAEQGWPEICFNLRNSFGVIGASREDIDLLLSTGELKIMSLANWEPAKESSFCELSKRLIGMK